MNNEDFRFIQNYPLKVNMFGCRGNIYSLREAGWNIAIQCKFSPHTCGYDLRICGEHKTTRTRLMSNSCSFDLRELNDGFGFYNLESMEVPVVALAGQINIQGEINYNSFKPFTGTQPEYITINRQEFNPKHIPFFSDAISDTEIIIPEKNIDELLQEILLKQEPKQAELREQRIKAKHKLAKGEKVDDNILYLPNVSRKIELVTIGG